MYERLDSCNIVNDEGDVVPIDDYREVIEPTEATELCLIPAGPMSAERLATVSLLDIQKKNKINRLSAHVDHPAMSGEVVEQASQFQLGETAQTALDVYTERTAKLRKLGAGEHRATRGPHYQDLMITLTKANYVGISRDEVNAILAQVSPAALAQKPRVTSSDSRNLHRGRREYKDARSAAANDY